MAVDVMSVAVGLRSIKEGQMPLPIRRFRGYKTLGRPFQIVTARFPLESAVWAVQTITSTNVCPAEKPAADDLRVTLTDDGDDPRFVKIPMI